MKTDNSRLKIAYLISNYLPSVGGAQVFVHRLATSVAGKGHGAIVITPGKKWKYDTKYDYDVLRINPIIYKLIFYNFALGKKILGAVLRDIQRRYSFDIWQVTIGYPLGAASADYFNAENIPSILRCAGEDIQMSADIKYGYRLDRKVDNAVKENYKKFDAIITANNSFTKELKDLGISGDKINIIPNGVDYGAFRVEVEREKTRRELGIDDKTKLIISVGRNHPKKGFLYIPQIARRLSDKGLLFRWLLIGKGCESIKSQAIKHGVQNLIITKDLKVEIAASGEPVIPSPKLIRYYKASDIFVYPTMIELFAKVIIEAMAAGLPIVTTDAPGVDDMVIEGQDGLKNRVGDIDGMTRSISSIFSDVNLARRLSENALKRAESYDWGLIADRYMLLYRDLFERHKRGSS
ncbi:MAG: glycosyltransferase family 4 protein [Candidatus Omnitrophica bacterium]|nr:glycosyltransferase family 4 protein [Candidatus Omnitrophota bacterium]